jgi:hypothetical protein
MFSVKSSGRNYSHEENGENVGITKLEKSSKFQKNRY